MRPVFARQKLVNHRDLPAFGRIAVDKGPAAEQGDSHRPKIAGIDRIPAWGGRSLARSGSVPVDHNDEAVVRAAEWQRRSGSRLRHSGQGPHAFEKTA